MERYFEILGVYVQPMEGFLQCSRENATMRQGDRHCKSFVKQMWKEVLIISEVMEDTKLIKVYPKFCVNSAQGAEQHIIFQGGSGSDRCCLVYSITPVGPNVKGGDANRRSLKCRRRRHGNP